MTSTISREEGADCAHQWINLFAVSNQDELALDYRLLDIRGLPRGEHYDKCLNQLVKALRYRMRQPVALVRQGDGHSLAIPAEAPLPALEHPLMPHVVTLLPRDERSRLDLAHLDDATQPIATAFVQFALGGPLMRAGDLWSFGKAHYAKRPLDPDGHDEGVDIYPGFMWSVVAGPEGRLFLAVDTCVRYVDHLWLPERLDGADPNAFRYRHCLYHFGNQWYVVQLWGITGQTVARQRFVISGRSEVADVFSYTQANSGSHAPQWVQRLDPESPAIVYRYPGNEQERYGALALCKLLLRTSDERTAGLHRRSIVNPTPRFARISEVVTRYFQHATLGGSPIKVAKTPREIERRVFSVPAQEFGYGRVLAVKDTSPQHASDVVPLEQLGQRRLRLALDAQLGPLDRTPFDVQYLFVPQTLPRAINDDFERRFVQAMRQISGQSAYAVRRIVYNDQTAPNLYRQVQVIKEAITRNQITRGYALLVLPERVAPDLHHYIKHALWPDLQFQCATACKLRRHYVQRPNGGFAPAPGQGGKLESYVRNCALGMMVINRKWLWALAAPLHHDVYVGIDVLNGMAGVTFVYSRGRRVIFRNFRCKHKERLTAAQVRTILVEHLREDLADLQLRPQSLVIHRDGRTFASEIAGLRSAVNELIQDGVLPADVQIGVVDIRKSTASHLRLAEGRALGQLANPPVGSYYILGPQDGLVCTTGRPFSIPGTARPLAVSVIEGALDIADVLEDIFALSQLAFTAPDKCVRLPVTIKMADDFLEPIAGAADDEGALYDDEQDETVDEADGSVQLDIHRMAANQ